MAEENAESPQSLPLAADTLESIPEDFRDFYAEKEGKFEIRKGAISAIKNAKDHEKTARQAAVSERDAALAKIKEFEDRQKAAELEANGKKAKDDNDFDGWKKNFDEQKEKDIAALKEEFGTKLSDREQRLEKALVSSSISSMAKDAFGEDAAVCEYYFKDKTKLYFAENGDTEVIFIDKEGNRRDITRAQMVEEAKADPTLSKYALGSTASGGGATGSSASNNGGAGNKKPNELSEKERLALHQSNPDAFKTTFGGRRKY